MSTKDWTIATMTDEHKKLYYLLSKYSHPARSKTEEEIWMKELPLRVFAYEGITKQVFKGYDYAPMSIEIAGGFGRRFLNISQEMEDDIADLRELGLLDCLKLSTTTYQVVNAYRIRENEKVQIPEEFKKEIDGLCNCPKCGQLLETRINPNPEEEEELIEIFCRNPACGVARYSNITAIEDVSYVTEAYIPNIPFYDLLKRKPEEEKS